jgi:uncharacterized protein YdiU (UPF0061 family)
LLPSSFAQLPDSLYARVAPTPVSQPVLIRINEALAAELQLPLAGFDGEALASLFSGNTLPDGSVPLAMGYAGHQFGGFDIPVAAMGGPRWARCCASTLSVKRCMHSAFRRRAPSPP